MVNKITTPPTTSELIGKVNEIIDDKQDALVSGTNIKTINNTSILGSGNIDIQGGGSSYTAGTGINITNDVISVEGVKDQRNTTTTIKTWTGTKAQYDAIVTKDNNTLYNITDDTDVSLTILEALYPVGSVYITTANTCPLRTLISGSTWVEETSRILVDKYVSGTDWWELYSDGWCRQGGIIQMSGSGVIKTLLKSYKDTNYNVLLTCGSNKTGWPIAWTNNSSKTNSSFHMDGTGNSGGAERTIQVNWEACGYTSTTTTYKRFRRTA